MTHRPPPSPVRAAAGSRRAQVSDCPSRAWQCELTTAEEPGSGVAHPLSMFSFGSKFHIYQLLLYHCFLVLGKPN